MVSRLPPDVRADLERLGTLVDIRGDGWLVDGVPGDESLSERIYWNWYTRPPETRCPTTTDPPVHLHNLGGALRAAALRPPSDTRPWTVMTSDPRGTITARRDADSIVLAPGEYLKPSQPGTPVAPGEQVELVSDADSFESEDGMWWTASANPPAHPHVRFYMNARAATAPRVVAEVTRAFDGLTFQLKCPIDSRAFSRVDAIIVYAAHDDRDELLSRLDAHRHHLSALLDADSPPLTCRVSAGLSWADDVNPQRSYGESRCVLLAEAMSGAAGSWRRLTRPGRLDVLVDGLRDAGVDPTAPWSAG
jgi:hypothetical protein